MQAQLEWDCLTIVALNTEGVHHIRRATLGDDCLTGCAITS
jgi:hypothetical protein